jgi:hypothetical protein
MTARTTLNAKRGVRQKKRTPPRRTAHVGYQPAGLDLSGRRVRERYHAITDQPVKIGLVTRESGDALCRAPGPWADIPPGLFPPLVTCSWCREIAASHSVTIIEGDA